ncbi:MAG: YihY/virulence factor BrkB family protein [Bacteroidaceae bacterium]|nr:YihY/virulence factor BrkB family protein [Bacteroidaceae bacterium]
MGAWFNKIVEHIDKVWEWLIKFITFGIWQDSVYQQLSLKNAVAYVTRVVYILVNRFNADSISNKAAALTYSTLLSIVPILAILFGIARGFGFDNLLRQQIEQGLLGNNEASKYIFQFVDSYLSQTTGGVFLGVGLIALLWTFISLVNNMESIFNDIWYVKKSRTAYRKLTDYFSILILMPILIIISGGLSIFMSTLVSKIEGYALLAPMMKFGISLIPYVLSWLMFTALYVFMPNTSVKLLYALIAGLIAGSLFQAFQFLYISGQVWVSRYNAIYGSFAALPLFLLWLQVSWTICILGAQLTHIMQNFKRYDNYKEVNNASYEYRNYLAVVLMSMICKQYAEGNDKPYSARQLSNKCHIPIQLTQMVLNELMEADLLIMNAPDKSQEEIYLPASGCVDITLAETIDRLSTKGFGFKDFKVDWKEQFHQHYEQLEQARLAFRQTGSTKVKDL